MIKKINSKKNLPSEFSLDKYRCLDELSDKDFFRQLYWRRYFNDSSWGLGGYFINKGADSKMPLDIGDPFEEIENDSPDDFYDQFHGGKEFYEKYVDNINTSKCITHGYGIRGLSRFNVICFTQSKDTYGTRSGKPFLIDRDEVQNTLKEGDENHGWLTARASDSVNMILDNELCLVVDLGIPDEILVDDFMKLLPIWRKELRVNDVQIELNNAWSVIRRKIVEYRVLPYMDLISWAIENEAVITHGVLAVSLFPDGEKDGFAIAQTIKPFVEKLVADGSLEKIRREISK